MVIGGCRDTGGGWSDSFVAHTAQVRPIPQTLDTDQAVLIPEFTRALRQFCSILLRKGIGF